MMIFRQQTFFFADTTVNIEPDAETLAEIATATAKFVTRLGVEPRVAMLSFSNFGSTKHPLSTKVQQAVSLLHERAPDLQVDGEMQADTAVVERILTKVYPFSKLRGPANVLIFPDLNAANIAYKLLARLGDAGHWSHPAGMNQPVHVLQRYRGPGHLNMAAVDALSIAATRGQQPSNVTISSTARLLNSAYPAYEHAVRRWKASSPLRPLCRGTSPHTVVPERQVHVRSLSRAMDLRGKVNQPIETQHFERLKNDVEAHLQGQELFIRDVYVGADPAYRLPIRFYTPNAWHALFVYNMFLRPVDGELSRFAPGFEVLHAPEFHADPAVHGTKSGTFILVSLAQRTILIGGTGTPVS